MCDKDKFHELVDKAETDGQKLVDDANLVDSYVVTFVICREAIHYAKKAYRWVRQWMGGGVNE